MSPSATIPVACTGCGEQFALPVTIRKIEPESATEVTYRLESDASLIPDNHGQHMQDAAQEDQ